MSENISVDKKNCSVKPYQHKCQEVTDNCEIKTGKCCHISNLRLAPFWRYLTTLRSYRCKLSLLRESEQL